jgi:hypothetical protein
MPKVGVGQTRLTNTRAADAEPAREPEPKTTAKQTATGWSAKTRPAGPAPSSNLKRPSPPPDDPLEGVAAEARPAVEARLKTLDPIAQQNLMGLARSAGVTALNEAQREVVFTAFDKAPGDIAWGRQVETLAASPSFLALPAELREATVGLMHASGATRSLRETMSEVVSSPGFAALSAGEHQKLLTYACNTNPIFGKAVTESLARLVSKPEFKAASAQGQADLLRTFVTGQEGLTGVVSPSTGAAPPSSALHQLVGPTEVKDYPFGSGKADALRYQMEVDGRTIPIIVPKSPDRSSALIFHTAEQVTAGVASLPGPNRALVKQVVVEPAQNPADAEWARTYNDPDFRSYMTAGAAGTVSVYPVPEGYRADDETVAATLIHETGHVLTQRLWGGSYDGAGWNDWKAAITADSFAASKYARNTPGEDFSETIELYTLSKNKPGFEELRQLMPARFKLLEQVLSKPLPTE